MWILTREINDYNQDGQYYVKAFINKPSREELKKYGIIEESYIDHILNGGGREDNETEWFYLIEETE